MSEEDLVRRKEKSEFAMRAVVERVSREETGSWLEKGTEKIVHGQFVRQTEVV